MVSLEHPKNEITLPAECEETTELMFCQRRSSVCKIQHLVEKKPSMNSSGKLLETIIHIPFITHHFRWKT